MVAAAKTSGRTVRAAVADAISAARTGGRLEPWHEPAAAVALKVAAALGRQKLPIADLVRLSGELQKLLAGLPLAPETPKGAGDDGPAAPAGGPGEGRSHPVGLAIVLGSAPEMGDTALPG